VNLNRFGQVIPCSTFDRIYLKRIRDKMEEVDGMLGEITTSYANIKKGLSKVDFSFDPYSSYPNMQPSTSSPVTLISETIPAPNHPPPNFQMRSLSTKRGETKEEEEKEEFQSSNPPSVSLSVENKIIEVEEKTFQL